MKKVLFVVFASALAACAFAGTRGSGDVKTELRHVEGFKRVDVSDIGSLSIEKGKDFKVEVTLDDNLLPKYETIVRGDTLVIRFAKDANVSNVTKLHVALTMPDIAGVDISGVASVSIGEGFSPAAFSADLSGTGSLDIGSKFSARRFEGDLSGAGSIKGRVVSEEVEISISGTGSANLEGAAGRIKLDISGVGSFRGGKGFKVAFAEVELSGTGSADLDVTDSLKADLSGLGSLTYGGSPKVEQDISGLGKLRQRK